MYQFQICFGSSLVLRGDQRFTVWLEIVPVKPVIQVGVGGLERMQALGL